jgi:hypothetical protein
MKRLKPYGIYVMAKRGKGSELVLLKPNEPGSKKGSQYPIKHHGDNTEYSVPVIDAILRRFNVDDKFWD